MARGRLTEKYVQNASVRWLASYYEQNLDVQGTVFETEVGVRKASNLGNGRADGLIIAQLKSGTIFVASLEAKSSRTFFNIMPWYQDGKWLIHAIRKDCRREGIGLIRVSAGEKIMLLEKPKPQKLPRGYEDFLSCYARAKILCKKLWAKLEDIRTYAVGS